MCNRNMRHKHGNKAMMSFLRRLKILKERIKDECKIIARKVIALANKFKNFGNKSKFKVPDKQQTKESVRSRVAMDFTGAVGRIVEDPQEADAIAVAEGYSWKRRWRPSPRGSGPSAVANASAHIQTLEGGVHITQPWFHSGMTRDQATSLVQKHGTVDGVFLVRESRSNPGSFVLTYKCGAKVIHAQINPIVDALRDRPVFSLDSGVTKFYDILQLVEFYQLNAGCLPTRLTHYVVQNANTVVSMSIAAQGEQDQQQPNTSTTRSSTSSGGSNN